MAQGHVEVYLQVPYLRWNSKTKLQCSNLPDGFVLDTDTP